MSTILHSTTTHVGRECSLTLPRRIFDFFGPRPPYALFLLCQLPLLPDPLFRLEENLYNAYVTLMVLSSLTAVSSTVLYYTVPGEENGAAKHQQQRYAKQILVILPVR